jgi:galactose-6-phosphate isomerase
MPQLDCTDIVLDPEFVTLGLICKRNAVAVGLDGLGVDTQTTTPFVGVVTNDRGDVLRRLAEGERIEGSIVIHSQFPLRAGSAGYSADIVTWQGNDYTVTALADYSSYGRGFTVANCTLKPLSG